MNAAYVRIRLRPKSIANILTDAIRATTSQPAYSTVPQMRARSRFAEALPSGMLALAVWLNGVSNWRGTDWDNYVWAAELALHGVDPYRAWAQAIATLPVDRWPGRADLLPLQLMLYVGALAIGGSTALLVLFGLAHTAAAVLLHCAGRAWLAYFWAALPLIGINMVNQPSNKSIFAVLGVLLILAIRNRRGALAFALAIILGNLTWMGFAAAPIILIRLFATWRGRAIALVGGAVATALAHLPFASSWLIVYEFRFHRLAVDFPHASPLRLIEALIGPVPWLGIVGVLLIVTATWWFAWTRRGDASLLAVLAMAGVLVWRTDSDLNSAVLGAALLLAALPNGRRLQLAASAALFCASVALLQEPSGTLANAVWASIILLPPAVASVHSLATRHESCQISTLV